MANITYFFGSWTGTGDEELNPEESHNWIMWGFAYGDAVSVSAHPVEGQAGERYLTVEDVQIEGDQSGRRLYFTVRNTGNIPVPAYGIGFSCISN